MCKRLCLIGSDQYARSSGIGIIIWQGGSVMGEPHLAKLADGLAFYLRQTDMALCMVRHFVSLGLWKLNTGAKEPAVLAHIHET